MHALPIIENSITLFKKTTSPQDIIVYNYYRGIIFISLKKYQEAIDALKLAIALPTHIIHKVHIESYKKLILINLLLHNEMPSLPSNVSPILKYKFENTAERYKQLG